MTFISVLLKYEVQGRPGSGDRRGYLEPVPDDLAAWYNVSQAAGYESINKGTSPEGAHPSGRDS